MCALAAERALLLAAFPPELAGLDVRPPHGWRVACTGIGAVSAAVETHRQLVLERPSRVLFVGTCGSYDERLAPGDFIAVSEVVASSLDELEGRAARPRAERVAWRAGWVPPLPARVVAVTPGVTMSGDGARAMLSVAAAEHLELSGVFAACEAEGVPAGAALAVANRVGPSAHEEWKARHAEVSKGLVAALFRLGVL